MLSVESFGVRVQLRAQGRTRGTWLIAIATQAIGYRDLEYRVVGYRAPVRAPGRLQAEAPAAAPAGGIRCPAEWHTSGMGSLFRQGVGFTDLEAGDRTGCARVS